MNKETVNRAELERNTEVKTIAAIADALETTLAELFTPDASDTVSAERQVTKRAIDSAIPDGDNSTLTGPVTPSEQHRSALGESGVMAALLERVDHRIVGLLANLDEEQQESVRLYTLELLRGQSAIRRKAENHA